MKLFDDHIWLNEALGFVANKRITSSRRIPEWEVLRTKASNIKAHTITHLDTYLEIFEKNALKNGIKVHWAVDAKEHNLIVEKILHKHRAKKIVKSKSMLTEECGLNASLESKGYEVIDTDLGERIVQLAKQRPSHIVLPAIHLKKEQVATIFQQTNSDPEYLTQYARESLRKEFESADAAITGVNFAIANEGAFVVCTNEGNADLGTSLAKVHIAVMGIEKIIPSLEDLGVFLRLLARSATGQDITTYSSIFKKPQKGKEIHLVIVDNGRSNLLGKESFENALKCIRCGACMNICPVFRRTGGHAYSYVIPGPIGINLGASRDIQTHGKMAFASTLCGACDNVCPTKINLHNQILSYRSKYKEVVKEPKDFGYKVAFWILKRAWAYKIALKVGRFLPYSLYKRVWNKKRTMPKLAKKSFREIMNCSPTQSDDTFSFRSIYNMRKVS
ncbi:Predicted L-lactate dehydrogenase, Iron-sulfur cluster-binding subunit YkgF [hydrothermal vent metagenome]|uniref:Predicted L-lactate dehydrogenase, Iron-sulfur cluster-binding subunit YkgF n=1 Tax=hydrothermal vent metagenome TaxID=652676 RepID=A0A1W1BDW0_9ZZZZ